MSPDDGHPDLAANVLDLTGDARDEVVLWDQQRVWIYTQDSPFAGKRIYAPLRNPDYNESNYRTNVCRPKWWKVKGDGLTVMVPLPPEEPNPACAGIDPNASLTNTRAQACR